MNDLRQRLSVHRVDLPRVTGMSAHGLVSLLALAAIATVVVAIGPASSNARQVVRAARFGHLDPAARLDLSAAAAGVPEGTARAGTPEQQGSLGTATYPAPSDRGPSGTNRLDPYEWVAVSCRVADLDGSSRSWYRIATPPWSGRYYAPAGTFWNGDEPGRPPYRHGVDRSVPNC